MTRECWYAMKNKPSRKVMQLKEKKGRLDPLEPSRLDYPLDDNEKKDGWPVALWVAIFIILGATLVHWLIKMSDNYSFATLDKALPEQRVVNIPLRG